jgi:BlaR1 peptidase M56
VIPAYWYEPFPAFLWQVWLHASIVGLLFSSWARHRRLPSGRTRQRLLAAVLVLPLVTAAIPGRSTLEFRERLAWLDSTRVLAIPLLAGLKVYHVVLAVAVMMIALTVWQELLPALRRRRSHLEPAPECLVQRARSLPGWDRCDVVVAPSAAIALATGGWPWRPRLIVSRGALERLSSAELTAALHHERGHSDAGRWLRSHALFLLRLVQCYSPVALWSFREYCVEIEIACDADAVRGRDRRDLAEALLKVYESTDRRDVAGRSALRKRVEVLLDAGIDDDALPASSVALAAGLLLVVLPWVV